MTDNPTLHRASHAPEWVEYLQRLLNEAAGQSLLDEDGAFGEQTEQAVKQFQVGKGLTADGVVGGKTWAALTGSTPDAGADHHQHHQHAHGAPEFDLAVAGKGEYHADRDELHVPFIAAGDQPIPVSNFSGWVGVLRGDEELMMHLALRPANGPGLAHRDSLVWGVADGFKEEFAAGTYSYRAYLPPELGGYEMRGEFTIP